MEKTTRAKKKKKKGSGEGDDNRSLDLGEMAGVESAGFGVI